MPLIEQFEITDCGSLVLFRPTTAEANDWWVEHCQDGPSLGDAYAVEHRYAGDIICGLRAEG